jgi:hypothetical protein
MLKKPKTKA